MSQESNFVNGIRAFKPKANAPEFIKADLTIKKQELLDFLETQPDEIRVQMKESKKGGYYLQINTYGRTTSEPPAMNAAAGPSTADHSDDLPF